MFTSRSEFRISARFDNADTRLTARGRDWGVMRTGLDVLRLPGVGSVDNLVARFAAAGARAGADLPLPLDPRTLLHDFPAHIRRRVEIHAQYAPYEARQHMEQVRVARDAALRLPTDLDYDRVVGLSIVEKAVLQATRPETLAQARRLEGVTPAACVKLLAYVRRETPGSSSGGGVPGNVDQAVDDDMETLNAEARAADL
ncbi:mitochondrial translation optimization protein [Niveomyces insectorum RCEF 264]|uniref:Mitochondrial translation optimization protein n=1 Tax=Niveomyces insectorum RCEF 264 TaxID=1081102 RepID=A0A167QR24_9HYPO|nr:mitochondrial translation optimization protein [Niveomyces insectorum RCEF 264]